MTSIANAREPVLLSTKIWKPYQYYDDATGDLTGESVKVLKCAFARLQTPFTIEVLPWKRAQANVFRGVSDGFFSASWSEDRDKYAKLSSKIAEQNWAWYSLKNEHILPMDKQFKKKARVGATLGSNISAWLKSENYKIAVEVIDVEILLDMLLINRFDAFMGNEMVVDKILEAHSKRQAIAKTVERTMPVGVYFSHKFLNGKPDFLQKFNTAVAACRLDKK